MYLREWKEAPPFKGGALQLYSGTMITGEKQSAVKEQVSLGESHFVTVTLCVRQVLYTVCSDFKK